MSYLLLVEIQSGQSRPAGLIKDTLDRLRRDGNTAFLESSCGVAAHNVLLRVYRDQRDVTGALLLLRDMMQRCVCSFLSVWL